MCVTVISEGMPDEALARGKAAETLQPEGAGGSCLVTQHTVFVSVAQLDQ